jgi:ABC-type multidrug transport system ATPase subunit
VNIPAPKPSGVPAEVKTVSSAKSTIVVRPREPEAATRVSPAIVLQGVVRHYGRFAALRGVSAEFEPGKLYLILGENGAGKSTLLRIVAGLLQPTRGMVTILGRRDPREAAASIGYMGHAPLLYDELSAMENLRYFASLYGISEEARCAGAIRSVGLDPELKRRVGQYSQGMRQRISLARALVHGPELLLLDEPFSNVDAHSALEMAGLLGRMRNEGKTILVVTHQPVLLETLADESLLLANGLLAARETGVPEYMKSPYGWQKTGLPGASSAEVSRSCMR